MTASTVSNTAVCVPPSASSTSSTSSAALPARRRPRLLSRDFWMATSIEHVEHHPSPEGWGTELRHL